MEEYIGGKHPVLEALKSGRPIHKIWLADTAQKRWAAPILEAAREAGVIVQTADRRKLDQLAGGVQHQGVVAQTAAYGYVEPDDLLERARARGEAPFLILLDEIEDPHNLGSIVRTANGAGAHGVVIPKRRAVGLTATVAKTSAGAVAYTPVARVTNLARTVDELKAQGVWTVAAAGDAERTVHEIDFTVPVAIVIGNEHRGVGRLIRERCDFAARLPMAGEIESLNASVAAGIFMYEVVRQRGIARRGGGQR
jgi:23S rRNA (guanosine2251-2'-O)-methyltransferase